MESSEGASMHSPHDAQRTTRTTHHAPHTTYQQHTTQSSTYHIPIVSNSRLTLNPLPYLDTKPPQHFQRIWCLICAAILPYGLPQRPNPSSHIIFGVSWVKA